MNSVNVDNCRKYFQGTIHCTIYFPALNQSSVQTNGCIDVDTIEIAPQLEVFKISKSISFTIKVSAMVVVENRCVINSGLNCGMLTFHYMNEALMMQVA